jgi:hypothetical protein
MNETPKVGRPMLPKKEKRALYFSTRVSPLEHQEIMRAIKDSGMGKSKWLRTKIVAAARRA